MQKLLAALAFAALVAGGLWALWGLGPDLSATADVAVLVTGPDGELWNGTVTAAPATPLGALLAAEAIAASAEGAGAPPDDGDLRVLVTRYAGIRPCGAYVSSIAGIGAAGTGGWVYEVQRDGAWQRPPVGACAFALRDGDVVWWRWVAAP